MRYVYVTYGDQMQVIDDFSNGTEVYNFPNIYSTSHSHIHYEGSRKYVYRSLSNPYNDLHGFYPSPEQLQYGAIQVPSTDDFPFEYEQLRSLNLDTLTMEQLVMINEYLKAQKADVKKRVLSK